MDVSNIVTNTAQNRVGQNKSQTTQITNNKTENITADMAAKMMEELGENTEGKLPAKEVLANLLKSYGLKPDDAGIKLLETLYNNQQPLNKETVLKLNQAIKFLGEDNMEKALFLTKNSMNISLKNSNTLEALVSGDMNLSSQLEGVISDINKIPQGMLKDMVTNIMLNGADALTEDGQVGNIVRNLSETLTANSSIEKNIVEGKQTELQSTVNIETNITKLFTSENLPETKFLNSNGFTKLAEELSLKFPDSKELINNLLSSKINGLELNTEVKNQIFQKISQMNVDGNIGNEKVELLLKDILSNENQTGILTKGDIKSLLSQAFESDKNLLQEIQGKLFQEPIGDNFKDAMKSKFTFDFNKGDQKEINKLMNELNENIHLAKNQIELAGGNGNEKLVTELNRVQENLQFVNQIKDNVFMQLPILLNEKEVNAELFVFKDKKPKGKKGDAVSALIGLDTVNMGRFEAYLQKNNRSLDCQFRIKSKEVEKLVRANIDKLNSLLSEFNYTLGSYSFKEISEKFTILDKISDVDSLETNNINEMVRFDFRG